MKKLLTALCLAVLAIPVQSQTDDTTDVLATVLTEVGFTRDDLGYRPSGYWNRFPLDTPHRLTSFDALFAEPLKLYDYARVMSNTVAFYLDPAYADSASDGLYKLVYNLGVDRKQGGFRSYSANLSPAPGGQSPFLSALERLYRLDGHSTHRSAFGSSGSIYDTSDAVVKMLMQLPEQAREAIAELLVNLADAIHWRNLAFRRCDPAAIERAMKIYDLADTQSDGQVYYPELDDIAATIDWASLHYAALKVAAATEQAAFDLKGTAEQVDPHLNATFQTPFGGVKLVGRNIEGPIDGTDCLLIIDFGARCHYVGSPASTSLRTPVAILLDLGGDDHYGPMSEHGQPPKSAPPIAGVGRLGVAVLYDAAGDDCYTTATYGQGVGLFGVGVLFDREGSDSYTAALSAQGCGYFGIGLCIDGIGDDQYYLYGNGQGLGGIGGGVGVCASFGGDDRYVAEPYSKVFNRGDYHSKHKINGNEAQGVGFGRRGDGTDGHAWAGGLGAIIDIHGDDHYLSGNWSLGVGYWFGTGIAVDRNGNDIYESCYFTQGSGAHFCNGILLDEGGDDTHELYETAGAALGFGWDYANALLINKGGNDRYLANMISMGLAQIRSCALLVDIGGNDRYVLGQNTPGLGEATWRRDYATPSLLTPYYSYAKSFGGFIDIGGFDNYLESDTEGVESVHHAAGNNLLWLQPSRTDSAFGANNFGVGIDIEHGTIPDFTKWDE